MSSPEVCWPVPMRAIGAQNLLTMPGGVSVAGYLHKKGGNQFSLRKWPLRYTILHKGCVYYFKSSTSPSPQGAFSLNGYNRVMRAAEETTSSNVFPFKIVHFSKKHRTWFFSAASENERRKWMQYLRREIDHYNDRYECPICLSSCSDSDEDSFYGTIERMMDIKHPVDTDDDYCEEDDEEDEEDYVKPDSDCSPTSTGHPTGPPPSYPPPPVPAASQHHQNVNPVSIPFTPHSQKPLLPTPPPPPPPSVKPIKSRWPSTEGQDMTEWRSPPAAKVLSICNNLETSMSLNGPTFSPFNAVGSQSPDSYHKGVMETHSIRPFPPPLHSTNAEVSSHRLVAPDSLSPGQTPIGYLPPHSSPQGLPLIKTAPYNKPEIPKPPSSSAKPQLAATKFKQPGVKPHFRAKNEFFPRRSSPDGQSFRSFCGSVSFEYTRKPKLGQYKGGHDSDDDYENMQLPDSVFIDTTETLVVERLFRQMMDPPEDGLYGIRNSGTKTSKVLVVWDVSIKKARNYRLFEEDGLIYLDNEMTFPDLAALIEHYYSHPLPQHGSLCLQKPYVNMLST
uniref:SH3 domain-binding protein 2 n=1 Tax=Tetraodon nigroviridis TaxID=99883 RepID=H3CP33_TETNG